MGLLGAIATGIGSGLEGVSRQMDTESAYQQKMALLRETLSLQNDYKNLEQGQSASRFANARDALLKDVAGSQYKDAMDAYQNAEGIDGMSADEVRQAGTQHIQGLIDSYRPDAKTSAQIDSRAAIEVGDRDRGALANQSLQAISIDERTNAANKLRESIAERSDESRRRGQDLRYDSANNRILFGGRGGAGGGGRYSPDDIKALYAEKKDVEKIVYGPEQQSFWKDKLDSINQEIGRSKFFANRPQQLTEADKKSLIDAYSSGDAERAAKAIKVIDFAFGEGSARKILEDYASEIQTPGEGMETGREPANEGQSVGKNADQKKSPGDDLPPHERGLLAHLRRTLPAIDAERKKVLAERAAKLYPR